MRYSVLLPTRNGGPYLPHVIASILDQNYDDFELVISDNANEDETPKVLEEYAKDPRVKVSRSDRLLSVTENWTRALDAASGDYLLMMGDDDALLDGYFTRMDALLERHAMPEVVTYNGYSYVTPNAIGNATSCYADPHFAYGPDLQREEMLSREKRRGIVEDMFRFRSRIPLNMQTTLVSRRAAARVPKALFQPPFPDHFALNSLLLRAESYLFSPEQLVVVGVSPKSFGHYYYGNRQSQGMGYLGASVSFPGQLPGEEMVNAMHQWLLLVKSQHEELKDVEVSRFQYAGRVVHKWARQYEFGMIDAKELARRARQLRGIEPLMLAPFAARALARRTAYRLGLARADPLAKTWKSLRPLPAVADITQFRRWLAARQP